MVEPTSPPPHNATVNNNKLSECQSDQLISTDKAEDIATVPSTSQNAVSVPRSAVLSCTPLRSMGDLPPAAAGATLSPLGDYFRFLLLGGIAEGGFVPSEFSASILDLRSVSWTRVQTDFGTIEQRTAQRFGHSATPMQDTKALVSILVFGGFTPQDDRMTDDHSQEEKTTTHGRPSFASSWPSSFSTVSSSSIIRITPASQDLKFEKVEVSFSQMTVPAPRGYHAAVALPGEEIKGRLGDAFGNAYPPGHKPPDEGLFIYGGSLRHNDDSEALDDAWLFIDGAWHEVDQSFIRPGPRAGATAVYWKRERSILLFGGDHRDGPVPSRPWFGAMQYDDASNRYSIVWKEYRAIKGSPPMSRSYHSMLLLADDQLLIWGGITEALVSDVIFLQKSDQKESSDMQWLKPIYEENVTLRMCAMAVSSGKALGFGGCQTEGLFGESAPVEARNSLFIGTSLVLKSSITSTAASRKRGFTFKLITVGESGVGKTCLLRRFVDDIYNETHMATISTDLHILRTMVQGKLTTLQLWDTAGQERYAQLTANYARDAEGFLVVFDATRRETFDRVKFWLDWLSDHRHGTEIPGDTLLIGNKYDLRSDITVSEDEAHRYASKLGIDFIATSARSAMNVDVALMCIVRELVKARESQLQNAGGDSNAQSTRGIQMTQTLSMNEDRVFNFGKLCSTLF